MDSNTWVPLVVGGGGVAVITAVFQGLRSIQTGISAKARQSIEDLERWRDDADEARKRAEQARDAAYARLLQWQRYAGALEFALLSNGLEPPSNVARPDDER
jgi:hypothetical protein